MVVIIYELTYIFIVCTLQISNLSNWQFNDNLGIYIF